MRNVDALRAQDVAELLGIGRNTVYALAKSGQLPSYRVGRKLRFTQSDVERFIAGAHAGDAAGGAGAGRSAAGATPGPSQRPADASEGSGASENSGAVITPGLRPNPGSFVIAGSDIAGDVLAHALSERGMSAVRSYSPALFSLTDLYLGRADAAVVNLFDRKTSSYNTPFVQRVAPGLPCLVVRLGHRKAGLAVALGNPKGLQGWGGLLRPGIVLANAAPGTGERVLLDGQLAALEARPETIEGYDREVTSPTAAAAFVTCGAADACVGTARLASETPGLDFIALQDEWVDVVVAKNERTRPLVRALRDLTENAPVAAALSCLGISPARLGCITYEC